MTSLHFHPLRVRALRPDTDDALVLDLELPEGSEAGVRQAFAYEPGQYLTLRATVDGQEQRRSYSICAGAGEGLRVGVRRVPGGLFSTWLHRSLKPGDLIDAMPPQGRFTLAVAPLAKAASATGRHVLGIAGGSGITPILGILKTLLATEPHSRFTLVYANRNQASTMFKEELEDLKNRHLTRLAIHPVFSREQVDSPIHMGRVDAAKLRELLQGPLASVHFDAAYICGPHGLNDAAEGALREAGLAADTIHVERFGVPPSAEEAALHAPRAGDAPQAVVRVLRDGLTRELPFEAKDLSILQAAARAGMDVPYSCRSGVCGTCRARLQSGQVRMDRNFALEPHEVAEGFILTCQAHPLTPEVAVSFDDR
jgi:ring-1,2-phenylacetyl-CoA epoxidase subunit PaaE